MKMKMGNRHKQQPHTFIEQGLFMEHSLLREKENVTKAVEKKTGRKQKKKLLRHREPHALPATTMINNGTTHMNP